VLLIKLLEGVTSSLDIHIQHFFKIVLYWCLDLIRHNIGTKLKLNKYILIFRFLFAIFRVMLHRICNLLIHSPSCLHVSTRSISYMLFDCLSEKCLTTTGQRLSSKTEERTVCRRMCFGGYKRCMICKKITISRVNRDRRMGFCRQKLHWNVQNNRSSIIFSDETKIMLDRNGKVYVKET
jgi:hypothetical protein